MKQKILIIGGVAGGASAAARLRRLSENTEIIMFEKGPYISFANCGLPYHIGQDIKERQDLLLQTPESFKSRFNVDVRVLNEVIKINKENKYLIVKNVLTNEEYKESYDKLILSPGSIPFVPPIEGLKNNLTYTLRNVPDMDKIIENIKRNKPKHATVVGGGFIGLEMVEAFHNLGINVTLLEMADQVMTSVDKEMAGFLHEEIRNKGVELKLSSALTKVEEGDKFLSLTINNNEKIETNLLIMSIGVKPEINLAKEAGLRIGDLGGIWTNEYLQTTDKDIYAVGDAIEELDFLTNQKTIVPLAGPANRQGRMAADNIFGANKKYKKTQSTAICKVFDLAVASTGKNEKQLKNANISYKKTYVHTASHASYYPNAETVSLKLLFDPDNGIILGAQAIGKDGIDKRIDVLSVAQRAGMTVEDLQHLELTYAPPYGSAKDVLNQIAFLSTNILEKEVFEIHYDEIENLKENQLLLDVRNPQELEKQGLIKGAINIPVDQLRERMSELPKEKEIIVYCQVGLRGNVAHRQLLNNGYKSKNLLGGYRTYIHSKK